MIDDCCGAGDINEAVVCALLGLYGEVTAVDAQGVGALVIVKYPDGTCHRVKGAQFLETPWTGLEGSFLSIVPGDNAAGPAGNGHAPRLGVKVSIDAGQAIYAGSDGGLYVAPPPPAPLTPVGTCGIIGGSNGGGPIRAAVSGTWNWPCASTSGAPIYCDGNGQLRSVPDHTCVTSGRSLADVLLGPQPVGSYPGAFTTSTINNPSPCRSMVWNAQYTYGSGADGCAALAAWGSGLVVNSSPGYTGQFQSDAATLAGPALDIGFTNGGMNSDVGIIGPGGTASVTSGAFFGVRNGEVRAPGITLTSSSLIFGCTI